MRASVRISSRVIYNTLFCRISIFHSSQPFAVRVIVFDSALSLPGVKYCIARARAQSAFYLCGR